jgi:hypothetical protein
MIFVYISAEEIGDNEAQNVASYDKRLSSHFFTMDSF